MCAIQLDDTRTITKYFFKCTAGASKKCIHVAVLIHYINIENSIQKLIFLISEENLLR